MAFETILTSKDSSAYIITLKRPDRRNAFSVKMMTEFAVACSAAEEGATVRAVIVTGGTEYLSASADLSLEKREANFQGR